MRFVHASTVRAKRFAAELKVFLPNATLAQSQTIAARVYGYEDWYELSRCAAEPLRKPSPFDESLSNKERSERYRQMSERLIHELGPTFGGAGPVLIAALQPTARVQPERARRRGVGKAAGPGASMVRTALFHIEDTGWTDYARFWSLDGMTEAQLTACQQQLPEDLSAEFCKTRNWGGMDHTVVHGGEVQECWFRSVGMSEEGGVKWAAIWHYEVRWTDDGRAAQVDAYVDTLWARRGQVPLLGEVVGGQLAYCTWRQWLMAWHSDAVEQDRAEFERKESLSDDEILKEFRAARDYERVEELDLPAVRLHLPESDMALPSVAGLPEKYRYVCGQRGVELHGGRLEVHIGARCLKIGLTNHRGADDWGLYDEAVGAALRRASRVSMGNKFVAEDGSTGHPYFTTVTIEEERLEKFGVGTSPVYRLETARERRKMQEFAEKLELRRGVEAMDMKKLQDRRSRSFGGSNGLD